MQVIRITKKGKRDVVIQLDDNRVLILALEVFIKNGLKKGNEISDDRISSLIEQNKLFHIKQRAFRLLGRRQHSITELRRKLWNKDYDQKLIDEVIEDLINNDYLDDNEFIREFVAEKTRTKNWSSKRIKMELMKLGISSKLVDEILAEKSIDSDFDNAMKLGKKKYDVLVKRNLEQKELRNKLSAYLFSKGFDYDLIKTTVNNILKSEEEDD